MQTIHVALGIIKQGDVYHLQLRNHKTSSGVSNLIGCFGGMIEENETAQDAVSREVNEETSLVTNPADFTFLGEVNVTSEYRGNSVTMNGSVFEIEIPPGQNIVSEEGDLISLPFDDVAAKLHDMTPGTRTTFKQYVLKG